MPLSLAVSMSETWRRLVRQSDKNRCNVCEASSINKANDSDRARNSQKGGCWAQPTRAIFFAFRLKALGCFF
jgi:hypothetical protein